MVKPGYKQTEIGVIPEDWTVANFGSKVKIFRGGSPRPIQDYLIQADDGVNWIKIGDVREDDKYITSTEEKIIPEGVSRSRVVHAGDFILSNSMSFGRPYILNIDGCIHDGWLTIQEYEKTFSKNYLYYLLSSDSVYQQYISMAAGSSVKNLNKEKVSALVVAYPEIEEQERIADALSYMDSLIDTLEKESAKKKAIKQGAMQELLTGKKRLLGFSGEWISTNLGNCLTGKPCYGINASAVDFSGFLPRYIRITDITEDGHYSIENQASVEAVNVEPFVLQPHDIVLARTGASVGKSYLYRESDGRLVYAGFLIKISIDPQKADSRFIFGVLHSHEYWKWVAQTSMRSGQPGINGEEYASYEFRMPSDLKEQKAIADILTHMGDEVEILEQKLDKCRQVKQGMMQQLLTGKIRLG